MSKTLSYYEKDCLALSQRYESADLTFIYNILLKNFSKNDLLLELGCGSGRDANFLIQNGFDVIGIDGSEKMIKQALKTHSSLKNKIFHKVLPDDLDFRQKFDGIYSIAVLMHFNEKDLNLIFQKIYSLLNRNGKFIFSVPIKRDDLDKNGCDKEGRFFLIKDKNWWESFSKETGFKPITYFETDDGLDRSNVQWCTFVCQI